MNKLFPLKRLLPLPANVTLITQVQLASVKEPDEIYHQQCMITHTKCIEKSILQLSVDTDQDRLMASDERHSGSHKPH